MPFTSISAGWIFTLMGLLDDGRPLNQGKSHVKKGTMYSYFLNTNQPSNALQGQVPDQISGNYNYKMGVARVRKIGESKYKHEFTHMSFAPRNVV